MTSRAMLALAFVALSAPVWAQSGIWSDKALDQHKFPPGSGPQQLQRAPDEGRKRESGAVQSPSAPRPATGQASPSSSGGVRRVEMPPRPGEIRKVEMPPRPEVRKIEGPRRVGL